MNPRVPGLILASASSARAAVLKGAGLTFSIQPADVDETALKAERAGDGTEALASALADRKADWVSALKPDAWVIGADQILDCGGRRFDKPEDREQTRRHLEFLRGRTHRLVSAVCLAHGGKTVWRHVGLVSLTMRAFSDAFLEDYLARSGPEILESVGVYRLEGLGVQLFERIEGDYFTVLGLPLLPLLDALRERGVVAG